MNQQYYYYDLRTTENGIYNLLSYVLPLYINILLVEYITDLRSCQYGNTVCKYSLPQYRIEFSNCYLHIKQKIYIATKERIW